MPDNLVILYGGYRKNTTKLLAAGQTPKPGSLVIENSAGALTVHATQGGYAERLITLENGTSTTTAWTAGAACTTAIVEPGSSTLVLMSSGSANVAIGDHLCSEGNGKFEKIDTGDIPLCIALEAFTGSVADGLIAVRWL